MGAPNLIHVESLDDPRIEAYRNLKDRELARTGGRFIAEGELVVRRLLASDFPTESVLLAERRVEEIAPLVPAGVFIYVAPHQVVNQILGFHFHSGVIACGRRKAAVQLEDLAATWRGKVTLAICPDTNNTENLGTMMRISSAFGVDAMVLGPHCCDPFFRQAIRVSMGAALSLPIVRLTDLEQDLTQLRQRWGVQLAATVLADDAEPLAQARRPERLGVLFGSEAHGLSEAQIALCDRKITIPMSQHVDSLNVAIAAGIILYHFTQLQNC